jgi:hypothetical protein
MSLDIHAKLDAITWSKLHEYRDKVRAKQYAAEPSMANTNLPMLEAKRAKLQQIGAPPKMIEEINTLISLIREQVPSAPAEEAVPALVAEETVSALVAEERIDTPCPILYDPCTREPIMDFRTLEKRVNELRRANDTSPVGLYGLTNTTNNYDFIIGPFLDKTITLDDFVSFKLEANNQLGSDMYEVLSRLFVFFGGVPGVNPQQSGNFSFKKKIENVAEPVYANPRDAFIDMTCKATSKSGVSDITLVRTAAGTPSAASPYCETACATGLAEEESRTYLMSVKWYRKEKSAEHYDLEKLKATADAILTAEQMPYDIIVFLKSKRDFERAHQRAYRQYIRYIGRTFFGWDEDVKPFLQDIRRQIFEEAERRAVPPATILEEQYFRVGAKPVLNLQLHQEIITEAICDALAVSKDNRYLIGVLPRGGKTYIAGGIIREYMRRTEGRSLNMMWLTAAPTETMSQVGRDLIEKFQDFADFEFINVRDTEAPKKNKPYSFFFCSTQILTAKTGPEGRKRKYLNDLLKDAGSLGLIFFDEAHKTGTGQKTREEIDLILEAYQEVKLPFIFLTATYYNILFEYKILMDNTFIWDYTDVLKTRGLTTESEKDAAIDNLGSRFRNQELVKKIMDRRIANGESLNAMGTPYLNFPDLYFVSADFQEEALTRFSEQSAYSPDAGFNMKTMFATKADATLADIRVGDGRIRADAYKVFTNLVNPRNIISLLTPAPVGFDDTDEGGTPLTKVAGIPLEPSILGRIGAMSAEAKSRFRIDESPTLLMFMPTGGTGSNIYFTLCAWAALLMAHPWWAERYEVACVVDSPASTEAGVAPPSDTIHMLSADPKSAILALERKLHCPVDGKKPKGLIILAGQKLSMGVSLPCTDVVFLFNDSKSPDDIVQKMYRALTPSIDKKVAFVVDLNPVRSLAAVYGYTRAASGESQTKSEILDIIYDTYSWDPDMFDIGLSKGADARPQTFQSRLRELFEAAEKDPEYRMQEDFGGIDRTAGENVRRFVDSRLLSVVTEYFSDRRAATGGLTIELRDGAKASVKGGQLVLRAPKSPGEGGGGAAANGEEAPQEEIIIENFVESVKDFVKYLAITTTVGTLEEAVAQYIGDAALQRNVNQLMVSRGVITRADPRIVEVFVLTIRELSKHSRGLMRMFGDTKSKIDEPSARKNAVLKMIHTRLTPRKKQKEEKGEVFTPIELVEDMFSHLPTSVWKNPDLKWLDPANGIGNFPVVVFYRLNDGLRDVIPNEKARKKHIIENMLYMAEFQSSNSRVARNIISKLCDGCEPNIWTTNSLELTPATLKAHGWPEAFDVIMGNPPYNAGGILKGGGTIWPKFVKLAFTLVAPNGYITYIHPPGWRKFYDAEDRDNQGKIWYTIKEKGWNLDYVNVSDQPPKHFPMVDYYVIQAKKTNKPTKYDSTFMGITDSGETILDYPFIPNMINDDTMSILKKLFDAKGESIDIIYNQAFKPSALDKGKAGIPHYHFTTKTGEQQIYNKDYASVPEYITKEKVIMTFNGGYQKGRLFAFYSDKNMGTTNNSMYMLTRSKAHGDKLVKFFNSDIITFLMKITQYSASPNHKNEFKILNQLQVPDSLDYDLTSKEEELIRKVIGAPDVVEVQGGGYHLRKTRKIRRHH